MSSLTIDFDEALGYDPATFPKQGRFVFDDTRFLVAAAAVRTGKTYGGGRAFMRKLLEDYGVHDSSRDRVYWVLAPTLPMTALQKRELREYFNGALAPLIDKKRQGRDRSWDNTESGGGHLHLIGNRVIQFRGADHPESLVGEAVCGVWWTEAARCKHACWPNVRARLANTNGWMVADTSPFGRGWFYKAFVAPDRQVADASVHEWTAVDSPFVPREEIEAARETLPPEFFKRDFEASWETFSGRIYSSFDRRKHMMGGVPFTPTKARLWVDVNTTDTNPACLTVALVGGSYTDKAGMQSQRAHVVSEHRWFTGLDWEQWAANIATLARETAQRYAVPVTAVIDPSIHSHAKTMLAHHRVDYYNGRNDILAGIRTVGWALSMRQGFGPLLTFDPSCVHVANEFEGYSWKTTTQGYVTETPDKQTLDAHLLDGIRYGAMELWGSAASGRML